LSLAPNDRAARAARIRKQLGVPAEVAGGAVLAGAPVLGYPLLRAAPALLLEALQSGEPLPAELHGEPIASAPQFSRKALRAIGEFAKAERVDVPIVAGPVTAHVRPSAYDETIGRLLKLVGVETHNDVVPHIALARSSVPQAMHEIGHASPPPLAPVWRLLVDASRAMPGLLARGAIGAAALTPPDDNTSGGRRFVYEHAPALMASTFLPELVEEGRATAKAIAGARRFGPGASAALKELGPAFATHFGAAAAPVLATALAQRLVQYLYDRAGERRKTAAAEPKMSGALKAPAAAAWHLGAYAKPKTTTPRRPGAPAQPMPTTKPPSNRAYHQDVTKSMNDPARGSRLSVPQG
jgi:hypothetical protein